MFVRVILLAAAIFIVLNLIGQVRRLPPAEQKKQWLKYGSYTLVVTVIFLAITGRLHWIGALIAGLLPFVKNLGGLTLRALPFLKWLKQQRFANSVMATALIRIIVDAKSGQLQGEILSGEHAGSTLDSLDEEQLKKLLQNYQQLDAESARLLTAYMQHRFQQGSYQDSRYQNSGGSSNTATHMDRNEALQVLGLGNSANEKDIITAHRKLMQKVHPDRGGSDYLAAKINQAKDFLLKT